MYKNQIQNFIDCMGKKNTPKNKKKIQKSTPQAKQQRKQRAKKQIPKTSQKKNTKKRFNFKILLWLVPILVLSYVAFLPSLENGLTNWDDDVYITDNLIIRDLNSRNLKILMQENFVSNYHPITMLSYAFDFQRTGLDPRGYHQTNMIIHVLNTALVFWFIYILFGFYEEKYKVKRSWKLEFAIITSALFGIHPLHVESVTWVSERKDVLYTFFFLFSLIAYTGYLRRKNIGLYIISILLFAHSLLSKGMAASLAVTLFAIDYFANRKLLSTRVLIEKIPFFVLAIIFGIIAVKAQRTSGALADKITYPFYEQITFATYGFVQYIVKLIAPLKLSAFYAYPPKPDGTIPYYYWFFPMGAIAAILAFIRAVKKSKKIIAFSILFFVINIFLVLQLIPVGNAIMADRYSYLPSIGFFILVAYGFKKLVENYKSLYIPLFVVFGLYVGGLSYLTFERTKIWEKSLTLWNDVLEQYHNVPAAWNNRGNALKDEAGKEPDLEKSRKLFERAINDYNNAIKLKPDHEKAFNNRGIAKKNIGVILQKQGKQKEADKYYKRALKDYNKALSLNPNYDDAYSNRGNVKRLLRDMEGALKDYDKSIELKPYFAKAYSNRAATKIDLKRYDDAIKDLNKAISIDPLFVEAYYNIANAYMQKKDFDMAIKSYQQALQLRPDYAEAYANMAGAKFRKKDYQGAISDYNKAIQLKPNYLDAYVNMGGTKYNMEDYQGAIQDFSQAIKIKPKSPRTYYLRGLAYLKLEQKEKACKDFYKSYELGLKQAAGIIQKECM